MPRLTDPRSGVVVHVADDAAAAYVAQGFTPADEQPEPEQQPEPEHEDDDKPRRTSRHK